VPGVQTTLLDVPASVRPAIFSSPGLVSRIDEGFFTQAHIFLELFLRLRQQQFDLIHVHAFDWPAFTCSALVQTIPVTHTIHLPAVAAEINAALRVMHQQGHILRLITVSHACAHTYAPYTHIDHIIYNGLDLTELPSSVQIPEQAPLLFAGRITPEKGVEAAIAIALRNHHPLLIAGGLYDRRYYTERIEPLLRQADGLITYLGELEHRELWQLMSQCKGLLFPIEWDEPFGLAAIEAMATGTPVIAFKRGAMAEVVLDQQTGFLIEPGEIEQAARAVDRLHTISRQQCRAHVEQHFSLQRMLDEHERVYRMMVKG
jgi:glycosyltransferase involved in cell wall biosynthesis